MKRILAIAALIFIALVFGVLVYGAFTHNTAYMMSAIIILFVAPVIVWGMMMFTKLLKKYRSDAED